MKKNLLPFLIPFLLLACKKREELEVLPRPVFSSMRIAEFHDPDMAFRGLEKKTYHYDQKSKLTKIVLKDGLENNFIYENDLLAELHEYGLYATTGTQKKIMKQRLKRDDKRRIVHSIRELDGRVIMEVFFKYDEFDHLVRIISHSFPSQDIPTLIDTTDYSDHAFGRWRYSKTVKPAGIFQGENVWIETIHTRELDALSRVTKEQHLETYYKIISTSEGVSRELLKKDSIQMEFDYYPYERNFYEARSNHQKNIEQYITSNKDVYGWVGYTPLVELDLFYMHFKLKEKGTVHESFYEITSKNMEGLPTKIVRVGDPNYVKEIRYEYD